MLAIAACGSLQPATAAQTASQRFHHFLEQQWQRHLRENPIAASTNGFHAYDDQWPDLRISTLKRQHRHDIQALKTLKAIDRSKLSPQEQLSYDLFAYKLKDRIAGFKYHGYLLALNQLGGIQTAAMITRRLRFDSAEDYAHWITRLQTLTRICSKPSTCCAKASSKA